MPKRPHFLVIPRAAGLSNLLDKVLDYSVKHRHFQSQHLGKAWRWNMFHCFKLVPQFDYSGSSSGFPGTTPWWIILVSSMWVWWSFNTNKVVSLNNLWMSVSHQSPPILGLMYIYKQCNMITNTSRVLLQSVTRNWLLVYSSSAFVLKFFLCWYCWLSATIETLIWTTLLLKKSELFCVWDFGFW